jgi:uncharacterized protein YndB with AHSA1/START domain
MNGEGRLITLDGRSALRFERRYHHPLERVWRAVSDPAEMGRWFPSEVVGDRAVGAELVFDDEDQRAEAHAAGEAARADGPMFRGTVVTYDPPTVFSFTWGSELLRIELHADGDGTLLVFTHVLSHPSVAARNGAGWHGCLADLDRLLGAPPPDGAHDLAVYHDYLARVGPDLGAPAADGSMTWERATHVEPDRVREATSRPDEIEAWGAGGRSDPARWDVESTEDGTIYRLTVEGAGDDPTLAATWHALLVQLDMYLAAGLLIPVEPDRWASDYERLLGAADRESAN